MRPLNRWWEVAGYGGLFLLALGLRLAGLEGRPLAPKEAEVAYAAWRLTQGASIAAMPSPLSIDITAVSFFLLGASDLTARLGSIVMGSLIVPTVALFRRQLGSWGALSAAALAAISPLLIQSSRFLSADAPALLISIVATYLLLRWNRQERWILWGLSALAGLLITGGPLGVGFVLVGVLFLTLQMSLNLGAQRPPARHWALGLGVFLVTFYLGATALTVNWPGIGINFGEWNEALAGDVPLGWGRDLLWATYEPLILGLGLAGLGSWIRHWRSGQPDLSGMNGLLVVWTGTALILVIMGSMAAFAPFLGLPLILWGGLALPQWITRIGVARWRRSLGYYLLALVGLALAVLVANWLTLPGAAQPGYYWFLALVGLAPLLWLIVMLWRGKIEASPAWALGLAALLALNSHSGSALNYGDAAAEPLMTQAAPLDITDMLDEVRRQTVIPYWGIAANIQLDPAVAQPWRWYLREYPGVTLVEEVQDNPAIAILTPGQGSALIGYRKGEARLWVSGAGPSQGSAAWWRWFFFRQSAVAPASQDLEIFFRE